MVLGGRGVLVFHIKYQTKNTVALYIYVGLGDCCVQIGKETNRRLVAVKDFAASEPFGKDNSDVSFKHIGSIYNKYLTSDVRCFVNRDALL